MATAGQLTGFSAADTGEGPTPPGQGRMEPVENPHARPVVWRGGLAFELVSREVWLGLPVALRFLDPVRDRGRRYFKLLVDAERPAKGCYGHRLETRMDVGSDVPGGGAA